MKPQSAPLIAVLLLWTVAGCAPQSPPSPIRLPDGACIDLKRLPQGWRVKSTSPTGPAKFGVAERWSNRLKPAPPFRLLVSIGPRGTTYRQYGQAWANPDGKTPSPPNPGSDVEGFDAFPADDGETIYVSRKLDAFMECDPKTGCTIHDGLASRSVDMGVEIGWANRSQAAADLLLARRTISAIRIQCSAPRPS